MTKKPLISLVVPFFNEQENLGLLFKKITSFTNVRKQENYEVMFINDCSTDDGAILIKKLIKGHQNFYLINLKKRSGQSGCFNYAFKKMKGDFFVRIDSDLQDDPQDLKQIVNELKKGRDLVLGIRKDRKYLSLIPAIKSIEITIVEIINAELKSGCIIINNIVVTKYGRNSFDINLISFMFFLFSSMKNAVNKIIENLLKSEILLSLLYP